MAIGIELSNCSRVTLTTLAGCLLLVPGASPQQMPAENFAEVIDVWVVNLEAIVTGRSGKRIPDLTVDDFELRVDGRETDIDFFSEVSDGRFVPAGNDAGAVALPPLDSATAETVIPTNYLVFIDNLFSTGGRRDQVLERIADQTRLMRAGDRMAVTAFDGRQLSVLADWTDTLDEARRVLLASRDRVAEGPARDLERRTAGNPNDSAGRLQKQVQDVLTAAKISLRLAGRPEGRRVMLLLSGGWPYEILEPGPISTQGTTSGGDGFPQDSQGRGDSGPALDPLISATFDRLDSLNNFLDYKRGAELYQPLSDVANMLGYTLYPVDVPGVSSRPAGADVTVDRYGDTTTVSTESANESSLRLLADETGGQALINDLRLQAVDRVSEDTSSYYWLGFQVVRRGDDQRHQIELTTRNPRLRVRTRQSFTDLSRRTESRMSAEEALLVDTLRGTELVIRAEGVEPQADKLVRVGLQIEIPSDEVTILPADNGYDIDLELTLIAIDQRAAFWDLAAIPLQRHLPSQPPVGVIFRHRFAVTLPKGAQNLAVALQDLPSGQVMTGRLPIEP